jgi:hypothetical protein
MCFGPNAIHTPRELAEPEGITFVTRMIEGGEYGVEWAESRDVDVDHERLQLAASYATLECLEATLCKAAVKPGRDTNVAAARAAQLRMQDLCTQLRQQPAATQCR